MRIAKNAANTPIFVPLPSVKWKSVREAIIFKRKCTERMKIPASDLWMYKENRIIFDVRTPAEFAKGHIPSAINLPLFSDEERAVVGTIYKQANPEKAFIKGLELAGPKMAEYVKTALQAAPSRKIMVYCWRGGKRSGSMGWLLGFGGFDVQIIEGGYKAYRNYLLTAFEAKKLSIAIIGGRTGSGKSQILRELALKGEQILDLETLACHKGSAFGWIGEKTQPTIEHFENQLFEAVQSLDPARRVWIENESRGVGRVFIPDGLWNQMKQAPLFQLEVSFERRLDHILQVYTQTCKEDLVASFRKLEKKIGNEQMRAAILFLEQGDIKSAAAIALKYYDKLYNYGFENNQTPVKLIVETGNLDFSQIADHLIQLANATPNTL